MVTRLTSIQSSKTRIIVADDHLIVRQSVVALLEQEFSVEVVAEAGNGREAAQKTARLDPDLIIIDLIMPGVNGMDAISLIKRRSPRTKILVLTAHDSEELVRASLIAGADGYLLKEDSFEDLARAIENVMHGRRYLSPGVCALVVAGFRRREVCISDTNGSSMSSADTQPFGYASRSR